jgi:hypothetical protein
MLISYLQVKNKKLDKLDTEHNASVDVLENISN